MITTISAAYQLAIYTGKRVVGPRRPLLATLNRRRIRTRMVPLDAGRNSKTKKVGPGSWLPIGNLQGAPKEVQIGTIATFWAIKKFP